MKLSIIMFLGRFPVVSETFIIRQMTGLLDMGHDLQIISDHKDVLSPRHPQIDEYKLLSRTMSMDFLPEILAELPVFPISGYTWPPGAAVAVPNWRRLMKAFPVFLRNLARSPIITAQVLRSSNYRYQAASLSALYRLDACSRFTKRVDICHAHFGPVGNSFRFGRRLWKAPLVVSFHGYDFCTAIRAGGRDLYRSLFSDADIITANSDYTRGRLEALGCSSAKIRNLPVGLDLNAFRFKARTLLPGEPVRILSIGRLTRLKGHEFVIRAIACLKLRGIPVEYRIVGDGVLRKELEALSMELGVSKQVRFCGALVGLAVHEALEWAHLFVMGSVDIEGDQEGQGLSLQEAQAVGMPVIATDHGALPEGLVPGQSGFLVPERDVNIMAERLQYLAQNPDLWPHMGRAGRRYVRERYDIKKLNLALCHIYGEAIDCFSRQRRGRCLQ